MTVLCPGCRRAMRVPPEKEDVPNLRARCSACGTVFAVAEASLAPAVSARPATPAAPVRPAEAPPISGAAARPGPPPPRPARGASWRRCATHADRPSEAVCTTCGKGWCPDCLRRQGTAVICASCDALCVSVADREAKEARARQRARPLTDEIGTVLRYPFTDATAFVAFAVVVGVCRD